MSDPTGQFVLSDSPEGEVHLVRGTAYTAPAESAWQTLHDLHLLSLGDEPRFATSDSYGLTQEQAYHSYSDGVTAVLAQLMVTGQEGSISALGSLTDFAEMAGTSEGLDNILLSAALGADGAAGAAAVQRAGQVWESIGLSQRLGAGATMVPIANPASRELGFFNQQQLEETVESARRSGQSLSGIGSLLVSVGIIVDSQSGAAGMREFLASPEGRVVEGVGQIGLGVGLLFLGPLGIVAGLFTIASGAAEIASSGSHPSSEGTPPASGDTSSRPGQDREGGSDGHGATTRSFADEARSFRSVILSVSHEVNSDLERLPSMGGHPGHSDTGEDDEGRPRRTLAPFDTVAPGDEVGPEPPGTEPNPCAIGGGPGMASLLVSSVDGTLAFEGLPALGDDGVLVDAGIYESLVDNAAVNNAAVDGFDAFDGFDTVDLSTASELEGADQTAEDPHDGSVADMIVVETREGSGAEAVPEITPDDIAAAVQAAIEDPPHQH